MLSDLRERDEALPLLPLSVFTEKNILRNLFIVHDCTKGPSIYNSPTLHET